MQRILNGILNLMKLCFVLAPFSVFHPHNEMATKVEILSLKATLAFQCLCGRSFSCCWRCIWKGGLRKWWWIYYTALVTRGNRCFWGFLSTFVQICACKGSLLHALCKLNAHVGHVRLFMLCLKRSSIIASILIYIYIYIYIVWCKCSYCYSTNRLVLKLNCTLFFSPTCISSSRWTTPSTCHTVP